MRPFNGLCWGSGLVGIIPLAHCVFIVFTICVFQVHLIEKQEMKRQVLKKRAEQTKEPRPSHVFFSRSHLKDIMEMCTYFIVKISFTDPNLHGSASAFLSGLGSWSKTGIKNE